MFRRNAGLKLAVKVLNISLNDICHGTNFFSVTTISQTTKVVQEKGGFLVAQFKKKLSLCSRKSFLENQEVIKNDKLLKKKDLFNEAIEKNRKNKENTVGTPPKKPYKGEWANG